MKQTLFWVLIGLTGVVNIWAGVLCWQIHRTTKETFLKLKQKKC